MGGRSLTVLAALREKEHAIRRFSSSGAWGEIVCLSGLSA